MNVSRKFYEQKIEAKVLRIHPVGQILSRVREATKEFPKAMLFELKDHGFDSLFEQACACIISVRTLDEVSLPASLRLFEKARDAFAVDQLGEDEIYQLIRPSSFGKQKAKAIKELAQIAIDRFVGQLPFDYQTLTELPGLGPSSANLVLGVVGEVPALGVDIHVHRVTNRWGYLNTKTAEESLLELARKLPKKHWTEINEVLVPFGKHICTGQRPKCSVCPVFQFCERRGVRSSL